MRVHLAVMGVVMCAVMHAGLAQQNNLTVVEGGSADVELPFVVARFDVGDRAVVAVNLLGERRAAIQGMKGGATTVTFLGAENQSQSYEVRVQADIAEILSALRVALEDVPEVDFVRAGDRVVIRGRVASLANWNQIERVVAAFGQQLLNLATLEMPPEILVDLREGLRKAGFEVADSPEKVGEQAPGMLSVTGSGRTVYLAGAVYSREQLERIHAIIEAQRWLTVRRENEENAAATQYTAIVNVSIVPLIIEVDVAFIAISDEDYTKVGVNLFEAGLLSIDAAGAFVGDMASIGTRQSGWTQTDGVRTPEPSTRSRARGRTEAGSLTYGVFSEMAGTLSFFTKENPDRVIHRGQLHFRNGADNWRELHSGGTLKLRLVSERETSIEDIDYGFILKVKGGLKDADSSALELEFELSTPTQVPNTLDYDLRRDRVVTSVDCKVGHTMVLGGVNSLLDSVDAQATPILRSIPLLRVFFSERTSSRTDARMLVLVSPHIVRDMGREIPLSDENSRVMEMSGQSPEERTERRRRRFFFF